MILLVLPAQIYIELVNNTNTRNEALKMANIINKISQVVSNTICSHISIFSGRITKGKTQHHSNNI